MNTISTDQILNQIRSLNAELQAPTADMTPAADAPKFGDLLKNTIDTVNDLHHVAGKMKGGFENGTGDATLVEVMVATQKADLSFRAMTEVRNKLVTAYQEIMNMPV